MPSGPKLYEETDAYAHRTHNDTAQRDHRVVTLLLQNFLVSAPIFMVSAIILVSWARISSRSSSFMDGEPLMGILLN
jgi:hypothetical protein